MIKQWKTIDGHIYDYETAGIEHYRTGHLAGEADCGTCNGGCCERCREVWKVWRMGVFDARRGEAPRVYDWTKYDSEEAAKTALEVIESWPLYNVWGWRCDWGYDRLPALIGENLSRRAAYSLCDDILGWGDGREWDAMEVKIDEPLMLHYPDRDIQIPNHFLSDLTYREYIEDQQKKEEKNA